ncbi:succinate dehydrogenase, hydrophobic membrane anchor protein [Dongia soli]|uniref:Succinate dehydrogenase hydrophobic membrane anchor subunit n=1 Tax=Dongia soli TaxID=600628 RepID=A0ABU5E5Z4_9PROT|nr:succinate dehydrogenase, hydrophobic membrane anchor protein [Dongia soli]MDY0881732.1 succinate dehydrogenase, hydrophobic membrane anchor protein [Dongia soli]
MAGEKGLRSELGRVRGLGSAKEGVNHWWRQRLTSLALIPLSLWFVGSLVFLTDTDHATAVAWLGSPVTLGLMVLFLGAMFYHAALGLQVVIEDYVSNHGCRKALIVLTNFACFALMVAAVVSLLVIAFGG